MRSDSPLKILIVSETYPPDMNGAAVFTQHFAEGLAQRGHTIKVLGPGSTFKDEIKTEKYGVEVFRFKSIGIKPIHPYFRVIYRLGIHRKIKKYLQNFQPDIIHIQNHFILGRGVLKVAKKMGIPVVGTNHFMPENLLQYLPRILSGEISKLMWKDFARVYNQLACVTGPSRAAVKILKNLGLKTPTEVISNGVDLEKFKKRSVPSSWFKKYKKIQRDIPIFLFVGRLEQDKNIGLILKATQHILKIKPIQVLIVGCGNDEQLFREQSEELGLGENVIFMGRISEKDLIMVYSAANIYLATGTAELQGLAVMEAMAASLPVLAVNAVALPELVKNGENGYLFKLDERDLAEKMLRMLKNSAALKKMAQNSLRKISQHAVDRTFIKFEKLYKKFTR